MFIQSPLLTDLYQLTMAYAYWKANRHQEEAVFHLFFRKHPFNGQFTIAAGLATVIEFIEHFQFQSDEIQYLSTLTGNNGAPLFEPDFLAYLAQLRFDGDIYAMPEGTLVHPHEPLLRIQANVVLGQLLETPLLNILNFQTLIATKAARVCLAAQGDAVSEFGLRRAQGKDGALSASRAAYIGGCTSTSNVLAGRVFGIPVKGTHAHSWVMSFAEEIAAFETYAEALPHNCIFLVDTYDTLQGVKNAIAVGQKLAASGYRLAGIRLDSGDLAALSKAARTLLDEAGFADAVIVASNDLDEYEIEKLKQQGAKIQVWGVGTKLVTAYDQAALGGVYKLGAIRKNAQAAWEYRIKLSEQIIKVSNPGILQVRRFVVKGEMIDMMYNETFPFEKHEIVLADEAVIEPNTTQFHDLLQPIFIQGKKVYHSPTIHEIRRQAIAAYQFAAQQTYQVGLEKNLYLYKKQMIQHRKGKKE